MSHFVHPTAIVDEPSSIGEGTRIWHFSHVMPNAVIGARCNLGQNSFVGSKVRIGDDVKIQNNVSIYDGTEIESDVFLGPSCVLTNVTNPRSQVDRRALYETTRIRRGATIGANATIVCGVTIERYAFVAAGAVVTKDVPAYALITGVPGRWAGWMSRHGHRIALRTDGDVAACPESGLRYTLEGGVVRCLDLEEDAPLPREIAVGNRTYDSFKGSGG